MDISGLTAVAAIVIYVVLALVALWGAFSVMMVWLRIGQKRFRNAAEQEEFLKALEEPLEQRDYDRALQMVEGDARALPQLAQLALAGRAAGPEKVEQMLVDHFQRDVLADLEYRSGWVATVIKAAPMVGLLGTVVGMMGAFAKLAAAENVKPDMLAQDISVALITTACGLAIAIPLVFCIASINMRIRQLEDAVTSGLLRLLEAVRPALEEAKP